MKPMSVEEIYEAKIPKCPFMGWLSNYQLEVSQGEGSSQENLIFTILLSYARGELVEVNEVVEAFEKSPRYSEGALKEIKNTIRALAGGGK
jgi:hypothetical protein